MTRLRSFRPNLALLGQLRWFIRLRWSASAVVILGALVDWYWLGWYERAPSMVWVGAGLLAYNTMLWAIMSRRPATTWRNPTLVALAWIQILLDLCCLTLLVAWTNGTRSPLLGFFVFHMVISSLLLPRLMAYLWAAISGIMLLGGLWLTEQWPAQRMEALFILGWIIMLLITVYLTSNITLSLRRHRRHVLRQRYRIRAMSVKLRHQHQAMVQQEKMAAMGQLAAGVAHEIANPLASIDSLLQLVERKPEQLRKGLAGKLRGQIERITQTVQQLTQFAHPGAHQRELTSLDEVVGWALQMIRFDSRVRKVKIEARREISPGAGMINARHHAMEQVVVNVILNALDAMVDQPEPRLSIRVRLVGRRCIVEITDNGHGIPPENLDRIFEPFFTTKPVGKGTGLGLAVSHATIHDHGGNIEVESSPAGTKFTISLPTASPSVSQTRIPVT